MKKEVSGGLLGLVWVYTWPYLQSWRHLWTILKAVELSEHVDLVSLFHFGVFFGQA